jgi:hypothetical protein
MCNNLVKAYNSGNLQLPPVEIGFSSSITAPDLQIKRLTAVLVKDSILFTLTYASQKDRFLSFFNPPHGDKIQFVDWKGIKKGNTLVTFYIAKDKLRLVDQITMRFSMKGNAESDRNFIVLNLFEPSTIKLLGVSPKKSNYSDFTSKFKKDITSYKKFQDVRWGDFTSIEDTLTYEKITTLTYNKDSKFGKTTAVAEQIMEKGKNPGLGVRLLHKQGITGKGVKIAIIDQNLPGKHPEYKNRIVKYKDVGCNQPENKGSMHGPGVLSLVAGETIGTAPEVQIYFAAAPSWTADAKYQADALNWIIEENRLLPNGNKIRVVSVSSAPSGPGSPFKNNSKWDEALKTAEQEGIIVLDCTKDHGFIGPCYYEMNNPEDVKECKVGWPDKVVNDSLKFPQYKIFAPCSGRTVAEEYMEGTNSYQYCGKSGLSWSIPYVAGVMAMGWQIKPDISGTDMVSILIKTASPNFLGYRIIDPVEFIKNLQEVK